jgi:hypothetical protein
VAKVVEGKSKDGVIIAALGIVVVVDISIKVRRVCWEK